MQPEMVSHKKFQENYNCTLIYINLNCKLDTSAKLYNPLNNSKCNGNSNCISAFPSDSQSTFILSSQSSNLTLYRTLSTFTGPEICLGLYYAAMACRIKYIVFNFENHHWAGVQYIIIHISQSERTNNVFSAIHWDWDWDWNMNEWMNDWM